ncbi:MAG TPA: glycerol-3-phosphate dehydrogenase/oxidase [Thiotrichales bacterium]|nr:glycerol-3-phosphate dehydrogenase/oxidase [Thiotrichales bacterium]
MKRDIEAIAGGDFDLLIIGGGITGACLAWDAANRGLSVALVEKDDFGSATSSASSKLLHGGIRYLQQGRIGKVRESAFERVYFQRIAPHLSRYVPFLVPCYPTLAKSSLALRAAMLLYHWICIGQNRWLDDPSKRVPDWRMLSRQEVAETLPGFDTRKITGAALFHESHMENSERMTLAFVTGAAAMGAVTANYVQAEGFRVRQNRVAGIEATDRLTGDSFEISARCTINAAGPWIPMLNGQLRTDTIVTAFSKGAHIVTPAVTDRVAVALTTDKQNQAIINRGGRHVFIIPWRGHSLIGTTYDAYQGELEDVRPTEADIEELIGDINSAAGSVLLKREHVKYAYAGIYPLIDDEINTRVYQGTGEYQVVDHMEKERIEGLVTVFGAKFTTARLLAEKALNRISPKFEKPLRPCVTRMRSLPCGEIEDLEAFRREMIRKYDSLLTDETIDHLVKLYGTETDGVVTLVERDPRGAERLSREHPDIEAQIVYAVEAEMAVHLDDVIFRRTGLGTLGYPGNEAVERCADIMSERLGWDPARRKEEIERLNAYYDYAGR